MTTSPSALALISQSLECPKCGKHTIVEKNSHDYHCISCDFHRDLNEPEEEKKSPAGIAVFVLAILTIIILL